MNSLPHKYYSNAVRILICLLLLTSNSGGMVLCVDALGQVDVKPAIHHKHHHGNAGGSHCLAHTHHHGSRKTVNKNQPDNKIKLATGAAKYCNDISIFLAQIDSKPIQTVMVFVPVGHIETINNVIASSADNEINTSCQFSEFPNPPLGMLRTVILLT
ncbi:MAG: hypothetical protein GY869_05420 [Planctomycetes bacterium]|nr:hypothetical protein [Planctomycetota bacterium]